MKNPVFHSTSTRCGMLSSSKDRKEYQFLKTFVLHPLRCEYGRTQIRSCIAMQVFYRRTPVDKDVEKSVPWSAVVTSDLRILICRVNGGLTVSSVPIHARLFSTRIKIGCNTAIVPCWRQTNYLEGLNLWYSWKSLLPAAMARTTVAVVRHGTLYWYPRTFNQDFRWKDSSLLSL